MSDSNSIQRPSLTTEAADWYARLRAPDVSEIDAARFRAWLARDPAHRQEFDALDEFWEDLAAVEHSPEVTRERSKIAARRAQSHFAELSDLQLARAPGSEWSIEKLRTRRWRPLALAASVLIALAAVVWMQVRTADHYVTGIGEQRVVPLADGSVVTLNTATELRLHYSDTKRGVELISGQANFEVAKDSTRPFIVTAGGREVRAVGTQFDVYKSGDKITVTLIEGTVAVTPQETPLSVLEEREGPVTREGEASSVHAAPAPTAIYLTAGQQLSYATNNASVQRPTEADLPRVSAWRSRKLDFDDTLLTEAIAEANRYSAVKIELDAPELQSARISGTFEAGKNEAVVEGIQTYFRLNVTRPGDNLIVLTAPH